MWSKGDLKKIWSVPWRDRCLLVEAYCWLGLFRAAILMLPFRWIANLAGLKPCPPDSPFPSQSRALEIGWAIEVMARRVPWDSACLTRSLAAMAMLERRRIPGTLFLGIAKTEPHMGSFSAHAWVLCGPDILTGEAGHEAYRVVSSFSSARDRALVQST